MKDLMVKEVYVKDGIEKVSWNKIGVLIDTKNGKQFIKLFHMPNVLVNVFEPKEDSKKVTEPSGIAWTE